MEKIAITSKIFLNDRNHIPRLGFGVYQSPPGEGTVEAVSLALQAGYRHIDSAAIYGNERDVGAAVRQSGIPRKEIFVTTKLWNSAQGYDKTLKACEESLAKLNIEYIDLYLLHWPVQNLRLESWKALIELKKSGKVKSIGVSNFTIRHLKEFLENSDVVPTVNQVEFSAYLYQKELLEFCTKNKIIIEAYSPITKGEKLSDKNLVSVAQKYKKTTAQVLIRWALQKGTVPLPKSNTPSRIKENADVFDFEISASDMANLDNLNMNLRTSWDPTNAP
jgi:diketogulonate reductase-like aldo/keto reductase